MPGGSKPGERRGGRKPGTPNKVTAQAKEALQFVFRGLGGRKKLLEWAKDNPEIFYTRLWIKLLPQEVDLRGKDGEALGPLVILGEGAVTAPPEATS